MQDLDIRPHVLSEHFLAQTTVEQWEAGAFEYEIAFKATMDDAAIAVLAEWLCDNCTENFIVMKQTTETVAGGTNRPRARWERRKAGRSSFVDRFTATVKFKIRMHREDITAFRLTWIL